MKNLSYSLVVTALLVGNLLPRHWFSSPAEAAPSDVSGSPNVAVDTYRNVKGTYVLWSDGRITSATGAGADLGRPYKDPAAAAKIGKPSLSQGRPLGSPNVAVKAIPRSDGTFILFANGVIKRPANADAAAGDSSGSRVIIGRAGVPDNSLTAPPGGGVRPPLDTDAYTVIGSYLYHGSGFHAGEPGYVVELKKPVDSASAEAFGEYYYDGAPVPKVSFPSEGEVSADGKFAYFPGMTAAQLAVMGGGGVGAPLLHFSIVAKPE